MLPNYLVIGAQKCATSSLCDLLAQHPDVFMTDPKEPYFFSHDEVYERGIGWYESLFEGAGGAAAVGEGSTTYTQHLLYPKAPERIAAHLPGARLIYIVRDPFERIESHWMHLRTKGGRETRPFNEAVRTRPEYIDNSLYDKQIGLYRERFPEDRILVLFFEDFRADPAREVRKCLEFLGVDPDRWDAEDPSRARHVSAEGREDTAALRPLRAVPGFSRLRDAMPAGVRSALRRALKKPLDERPVWDAPTRRWAADRLADDSRAFLRRYGRREDDWPF